MAMTLKDTRAQLESLGNEKLRAQNRNNGAGDNQFGVRLGDIRKLAAKIKTSHPVGHRALGSYNFSTYNLSCHHCLPSSPHS